MKQLRAWLHLKKNSIQTKLLFLTILLILLPVIISTSLSYYQYTQNFEQKSMESTRETIQQLSNNLSSYLDGLFKFSETVYYNTGLMNQLEEPEPDTVLDKLHKEWAIEDQLDDLLVYSRSDILSAYIMTPGMIYGAGRFNNDIDQKAPLNTYDWYRKAQTSTDAIYVPTHLEELITNPQNKVFSVVRRINSIQNNERMLGVLKIDADYSSIQSICDQIQMGKNGGILIEDQNNAVIYSSVKNQNNKTLHQLVERHHQNPFQTNIDGKPYYITSIELSNAKWAIISFSSITDLNKNAIHTRNMTVLIDLLCSGIAVIFLLILTTNFLRPLLEIVHLMKKVQTGNLEVSFPEKRKDEIGYLGSSFNTMVLRVKHMMQENTDLVKEVYESKLLQTEAQINALYSQIKPHFLFNTLNMISLSIRCGKEETALANIERLSDLLRCMSHFNQEITIREETKLLKDYLNIQKSRYDDRLDYTIDIDTQLNSYCIPAMIFQPIVENTITHGCEQKREKTVIRIFSETTSDHLVFHIEDNAGGMNAETLKKLEELMKNKNDSPILNNTGEAFGLRKKHGIGLLNVNRRLQIKYGEKYGLRISSTEHVGTHVQILLPKPACLEEL